MANQTPRFGLTTFDAPTDQLDYRQYKFSAADRELVDRVLTYAVENHTHTGTGETPATETAPTPPVVNVSPTGGRLPANAAVYYRYGLVDSAGQEHLASQPSSTQTGPVVISPALPTLDIDSGGGLVAGTYSYTISAYTQDTTCETMTSGAVSTYLPTGGAIAINLPPVPSGASGYNVYRKGPMDTAFSFLAARVEDPTIVVYVDDGGTAPDTLRSVPTANTTSTTSSATITAPVYPFNAGAVSWRVYRTFDPANWDNSLIQWEDSGSVTDTGHATVIGSPLTANAATSSPAKIDLGDDTTGTLPATATPTTEVVTFAYRGPVEAGDARWQWINDFDQMRLISFRANLGKGRVPTEQPVQVALERLPAGASDWTRYTYVWGSDFLAEVQPGTTFGSQVPFPYGTEGTWLFPGDALRSVVVQDGGPSNTDADLVVSVTCAVRHGIGPQHKTVLSTSYAPTFNAAANYQRTPPWTATGTGLLDTIELDVANAAGWRAHFNVLLNDRVVYSSDSVAFNQDGTVAVAPPPTIYFQAGDLIQIEVVPETGATHTATEQFRTVTGIATYQVIAEPQRVDWLPVGASGSPYDFFYVAGTGAFSNDLDAHTYEIDLPPGIVYGDLLVTAVISQPFANPVTGVNYSYEDNDGSPEALGYYHAWLPGPNYDLFVQALRHQREDKTKLWAHLTPTNSTPFPPAGAVAAFRGPTHVFCDSTFKLPAASTYETYDNTAGTGYWLHIAQGLSYTLNASPGTWLLNPNASAGPGFLATGVGRYSPTVTWTLNGPDPQPFAAVVMQLLGGY